VPGALIKLREEFPSVGVLLATHNPGVYIYQQILSLKNQTGVKLHIYWGDFDSPLEVKSRIRENLTGLQVTEINVLLPGPAHNFFTLLQHSHENFIAFCDQDDVWLPNKLVNQIAILQNAGTSPALVHSNSALLTDKGITYKARNCVDHTFESLAFSNCCQGCTITLNSAAREVILENLPLEIIWHDWWAALVISLTGKIYFSDATDTLYRIHSNNTIGIPSKGGKVVRYITRKPGVITYQIQNAIKLHGQLLELDKGNLTQLRRLTSSSRRIRFKGALMDRQRRVNLYEDITRRILLVIKQP
jgi:glycosyltransferase involved in cell wall biosynthesis